MGRKLNTLEEAAKKFQANGIECLALQGDVRKPDTIEKAMAEVVQKFGGLDVLVNNAAGNFVCSAEEISTNAFQTVIEIDLQVR